MCHILLSQLICGSSEAPRLFFAIRGGGRTASRSLTGMQRVADVLPPWGAWKMSVFLWGACGRDGAGSTSEGLPKTCLLGGRHFALCGLERVAHDIAGLDFRLGKCEWAHSAPWRRDSGSRADRLAFQTAPHARTACWRIVLGADVQAEGGDDKESR